MKLARRRKGRPVEMFDVLQFVANSHGIRAGLLLKRGRSARIARARQLAMILMRLEGYTLEAIGDFFRRDHTTVIHAVRQRERHADALNGLLASSKQAAGADAIVAAVARDHGITVATLRAKKRKSSLDARAIAVRRLHAECGMSYPEIARYFGYTSHSTVHKLATRHGLEGEA